MNGFELIAAFVAGAVCMFCVSNYYERKFNGRKVQQNQQQGSNRTHKHERTDK